MDNLPQVLEGTHPEALSEEIPEVIEKVGTFLLNCEKYLACEEEEIDAVDKAETFTRYKIRTEEVYEYYYDVLVIRACGNKCWDYRNFVRKRSSTGKTPPLGTS